MKKVILLFSMLVPLSAFADDYVMLGAGVHSVKYKAGYDTGFATPNELHLTYGHTLSQNVAIEGGLSDFNSTSYQVAGAPQTQYSIGGYAADASVIGKFPVCSDCGVSLYANLGVTYTKIIASLDSGTPTTPVPTTVRGFGGVYGVGVQVAAERGTLLRLGAAQHLLGKATVTNISFSLGRKF